MWQDKIKFDQRFLYFSKFSQIFKIFFCSYKLFPFLVYSYLFPKIVHFIVDSLLFIFFWELVEFKENLFSKKIFLVISENFLSNTFSSFKTQEKNVIRFTIISSTTKRLNKSINKAWSIKRWVWFVFKVFDSGGKNFLERYCLLWNFTYVFKILHTL